MSRKLADRPIAMLLPLSSDEIERSRQIASQCASNISEMNEQVIRLKRQIASERLTNGMHTERVMTGSGETIISVEDWLLDNGTVVTLRADTREELDSRPASDAERQESIVYSDEFGAM